MKKIMIAGSITVFVMILIGLIIGFYIMGYKSPMLSVVESGFASEEGQQTDIDVGSIIQLIIDSITANWWIVGVIAGIATVTTFINGGQTLISFLALFLPVFILLAVANLFLFPITTLTQTADTTGVTLGPLGVLMAVVFNVLLMLVVIEFISGRN